MITDPGAPPMMRSDPASQRHPLHSLLLRIEDSVLVALLMIIVGMAVVQIILRNLFGGGIIWGDIMVRILVLWIAMTGAMIASRRGDHINIDVLTRYLPPKARRFVTGIIAMVTAGICSVTAYYSVSFVNGEFTYGGKAFASVPVWVCAVIIPLGFAIIGLRYLIIGFQNIRQMN